MSDKKGKKQSNHWADITAAKIVREKGEKDIYTCASGITPSGTVHIGNFREIISVDLVVRALNQMGKNTRFIYSWDDYDVFRKVPKNMPKQEELKEYLRKPITLTPDPYGEHESYARRNEVEVEKLLPVVGIHPEYIYQAERYRNSTYAEGIKRALENKEKIRVILNEHRTTPLDEKWWPITVFCNRCNRDTTTVEEWNGEYGVTYSCESCGNREEIDLRETPAVKLFWRIDWPMRWEYEKVDFEPAGKDHHSEGGSFDTAKRIVREVYNFEPPITFQYDFIGIKGRGGKLSSSTGDVVSLRDVLEVYQPEVVRYMFAGTRPNTEFVISFDLDVIKIYEDYDKCERIFFGTEEVSQKRKDKESRIYELSQVEKVPEIMPYQVPFRHLCNIAQINDGNIKSTLEFLKKQAENEGKLENFESSKDKIEIRTICAWNWVTTFAPEDFQFRLRNTSDEPIEDINDREREAIRRFSRAIEKRFDNLNEKELGELIYTIAEETELQPKDLFKAMYLVLIGKDKGPRLASFILNIGKEKVLEILKRY